MNPGSIMVPKIYLGEKLSLEHLPNRVKAWGLSSGKYTQDTVANLK